jgi:hypothetical protein
MSPKANQPFAAVNVRNQRLLMAGFEVTFNGRFWVTPEATDRIVNVGAFTEGQKQFLDYHRESVLLQARH